MEKEAEREIITLARITLLSPPEETEARGWISGGPVRDASLDQSLAAEDPS